MIPKTIKNIIFVLSPLLLQNHSCRNLVAISPTLNRHVWNCNVSIFNQISPNVKDRCVSRPHEQFNLEDDSAVAAAGAWFSIQPGAGGVCYFLSVRQCCCPLVFCMLWYLWLLVIYDKTFSPRLLNSHLIHW